MDPDEGLTQRPFDGAMDQDVQGFEELTASQKNDAKRRQSYHPNTPMSS